jgi:ech hydrogenase subunit E
MNNDTSPNTKKIVNIPLGSQHISLLEPIKFRFECENEKILKIHSDVGFVHRGVEKACTTKFKYDAVGYVVARICGLCAITHSVAYTTAVESLLEGEINQKIKYLRMLMLELDRIHSHMLCLAHVSENAGYEAMFMRLMADREPIMSLQEQISGNRVQFDFVSIGGVNRDINTDIVHNTHAALNTLEQKIHELIDKFENNISLSLKYQNIGAIDKHNAMLYNTIGPLARAAGVLTDVRNETDYLPYDEIGFETVTRNNGDIHDRNMVRLHEILASITMCRNIVSGLPQGDIQVKMKGKPKGEALIRLEAPRGELMYYIKGSGKPLLERVRIKTPTFSMIPAFLEIFKGQNYADAPAILASFDPCMSCTAK